MKTFYYELITLVVSSTINLSHWLPPSVFAAGTSFELSQDLHSEVDDRIKSSIGSVYCELVTFVILLDPLFRH